MIFGCIDGEDQIGHSACDEKILPNDISWL